MFEYFPGNYVWNLGVVATLNSGGLIDEVDRACRPIRDAAARGEDAGTPDFLRAWTALTDQLVAQAEAAEKAGPHAGPPGSCTPAPRTTCARPSGCRAPRRPDRLDTYRRVLELQQKAFELKDPRLSRVEIPYEGTTLPAYFSQAPATDDGPAPVMIMWNGLDSTKEHMYSSGHWEELAARGISSPHGRLPRLRRGAAAAGPHRPGRHRGLGGRLRRLPAHPRDVDPPAIGLVGWSLGGYYAPRAAAFEKRLALVVAWGANHDWGAVQRRRLEREGERPVPHYWDHVLWVWGYDDLDEFIEFADQVNLDGVVEQITVPFLIAHGAGDRQIPLEYAHRSYEQAVASPKRELRVFTAEEGGTEHIGLDHLPHVSTFIADWVADTFAELAARR